ncbi:hypothetical protein F5Y15DRAFT_330621 [Xylariaceae sp. FL0016]|nr:hypothetical protein F5Y15DRAFT_330621 [Xylariaceae sp. FL0016]
MIRMLRSSYFTTKHSYLIVYCVLLSALIFGCKASSDHDAYGYMPEPGAEGATYGSGSLEAVSIAIATTILHPDPLILPVWLDYHLRWVQHVVVYMDDPAERPVFEQICGNRPVTLFDGSRDSPKMTPESRLIMRQVVNMEHAISFLRERGFTWLLHIDTDELVYGPGGPEGWAWATDPDVGLVNLVNHEVLPVAFDTHAPFTDCTYFWVNGVDHNKRFMAYGNGKSAVRLGPGVEPQGPHNFSGHAGRTLAPPGDQVMILHYPHPSYESWLRKFQLYGRFSDFWFGDKRAPKIIDFMRESRDVVSKARKTGNWEVARKFFAKRVLSENAREKAIKKGKMRRYNPLADPDR